MLKTVRIDFTKCSEYSFSHTVNENDFRISIRYSILFDRYFLDLERWEDGVYKPLVYNINLTTGANIFSAYARYGLGILVLIPNNDTQYANLPSADNLVTDWLLVWQYNE